MSDATESLLFWLTLLCSIYVGAVAQSDGPKCINGVWKDGKCVCNLGYKTVHDVEDVSGALQPVYCNTTVQIVLGAYQWTEQDVLQLAAADLAVVLATISCLALIHLFGCLIRLHVAAQRLNKLKLTEKAFLDYISAYHQEKKLLPALWIPPSTFQLLSTQCHETKSDVGEGITEPHQSAIEESDTETLQTRFNQTLEQEQSEGTQPQEHTTLTLWQSHCSNIPEVEEAPSITSNETGMYGKVNTSEPRKKALKPSKGFSKEQVPENTRRGKGDRTRRGKGDRTRKEKRDGTSRQYCPMDTDSQEKPQQTKKRTKKSRGDKAPTGRSKSKGRDAQGTCEAGEKRKKKTEDKLLTESISDQFSA